VNAGRVATAAALVAAAATACHEGGPTEPSGESAASWEAPRQVAADGNAPRLAVARAGQTAMALWSRSDANVYTGPFVWVTRRLPSGAWTPAERQGQTHYAPDIAVRGDGTAHAAWVTNGVVEAASFAAGSMLGRPHVLGVIPYDERLSFDGMVRIAANDDGNVSALWPTARALWAGRSIDGRWTEAERVSSDGPHFNPRLAVDPAGNEIAAWVKGLYPANGPVTGELRLSRRPAGGSWTPEIVVAATARWDTPFEMGVDAVGRVFLAWRESAGAQLVEWAARLEPGGAPERQRLADHAVPNEHKPRLAVASDGSATVSWAAHAGAAVQIHARRYVPGRGWMGDELVGVGEGNETMPVVATNADGEIVVAWRQADLTRWRLWSRRFRAGVWESAVRIPNDEGRRVDSLELGMDDGGGALALWTLPEPSSRTSLWASGREGRSR